MRIWFKCRSRTLIVSGDSALCYNCQITFINKGERLQYLIVDIATDLLCLVRISSKSGNMTPMPLHHNFQKI